MPTTIARVLTLFCIGACTQIAPSSEANVDRHDARMKQAAERYTKCLYASADKNINNATNAEAIAVAAHGSCWSDWTSYGEATNASYASSAQTPEEKQFAHDKAHAHLRQFELEAREAVMNHVIARHLKLKPSAK